MRIFSRQTTSCELGSSFTYISSFGRARLPARTFHRSPRRSQEQVTVVSVGIDSSLRPLRLGDRDNLDGGNEKLACA